MQNKYLFLLISFFFLLYFFNTPVCHAQFESVSITTYYPAPYGIYFELRTARLAVGSYYKTTGSGCYVWGGGGGCTTIAATANFVVDGNVGISTPVPQNALDVHGAVIIGGTYAGTLPLVPANGLVVEGPVGLGIRSPSPIYRLSIVGDVYQQGTFYYNRNYVRTDGEDWDFTLS